MSHMDRCSCGKEADYAVEVIKEYRLLDLRTGGLIEGDWIESDMHPQKYLCARCAAKEGYFTEELVEENPLVAAKREAQAAAEQEAHEAQRRGELAVERSYPCFPDYDHRPEERRRQFPCTW